MILKLMFAGVAGVSAFSFPDFAAPVPVRVRSPLILVLGPPGSGKTVNAQKISRRYGIPAISMADLLEQAGGWGKAGSKKMLEASVESGDLVSDEVLITLLEQRLGKSDARKGFLLDGIPSTAKQAEYLEGVAARRRLGEPLVVHLMVPDATARQRMLKRGRANDTLEIVERRLAEYRAQAELLLKRYRRVVAIDATGSPDDVWQRVARGIDTFLERDGSRR